MHSRGARQIQVRVSAGGVDLSASVVMGPAPMATSAASAPFELVGASDVERVLFAPEPPEE
jgi:ABC-type nitrate/sulfonate/bicarbonate transport system substrate-binding protein